MRMRRLAAVTAGLLAALLAAPRVHANFHLMKVVEVFPGAAAAPTAQYVVLQMYFGGQSFVGGHHLHFYDSAGTQTLDYLIPGNVSVGDDQSKILFGTAAAQTFFTGVGFATDFTLPGTPIDPRGGEVCFDAIPVDCLAWGNYAGSAAGVGTPFRAAIGLRPGVAVKRRLDVAGGATTLEAADDTDNCATDFVEGTPAPRNNAGITGVAPASTCGNGTIEGLEDCDDGNTDPYDTCDPTCSLQRLFADGMETGDLSRWTGKAVDGGDLTVTAAGAITGNFGAEATVNDVNSLYLEDTTPVDEARYRARFRLDPSGFDPGETQGHRRIRVFIGFEENPSRRLFAVVLRRVAGDYAIEARARTDSGAQVDTPFFPLTPGPHTLEVDWTRASGPATGDGQLRFWIDGTLQSTLASLTNNASTVDFVRLGALNIKSGASGTLRWDDFDSRRTTYIGP